MRIDPSLPRLLFSTNAFHKLGHQPKSGGRERQSADEWGMRLSRKTRAGIGRSQPSRCLESIGWITSRTAERHQFPTYWSPNFCSGEEEALLSAGD